MNRGYLVVRYTGMFVETMIWISRLISAEEASINISLDHGTSKSYSGEFLNSSIDLRARGLLERVQQNSNAAFPSVCYTHIAVMFHYY